MTMLEKLSYRSFLLTSAMISGVTQVFANGYFGESDPCDDPTINGTLPGCTADVTSKGIVELIARIIIFVLDLLGIIAVLFIIIAGIRLIVSQGEDEQKDKAKKTILYVVIGLIVILLARVIVGFVIGTVPGILKLN